jgi:hypothetical protein
MLPRIHIASPCSADWEKMIGDDRVRYCSACNLNVYNFSAMTSAEVQQLILDREGRLCGRLYSRRDGTLLTRDCPQSLRAVARRISRVAGAVLSAAMSVTSVVAHASEKSTSALVQIDLHEASISVTVYDPSGAVIQNARVSLTSQATQKKWDGATDDSGRLQFSNLAAGSYALTVEKLGFATPRQLIVLSGQKTVDVSMSISQQTMGVVVTGEDLIVDVPLPGLPDHIPDPEP